MKNLSLKSIILGFIICLMITSILVGATLLYNASEIEFEPKDNTWNVDNVDDAINDIKNGYVSGSKLIGAEWNYDYDEDNYHLYEVPISGKYKIELWGASGGTGMGQIGGSGAYTKGILNLNKGTKLYVYVGGAGTTGTYGQSTLGGYNGGGSATNTNSQANGGGGGGATDIRLEPGIWSDLESLNSRIMVAGAGGGGGSWLGAANDIQNSFAGGLNGYEGGIAFVSGNTGYTRLAQGGTQTSVGLKYLDKGDGDQGEDGEFGKGGQGAERFGAGGGAGYYGGGGGGYSNGIVSSGAGGSSYISGFAGCVAINAKDDRNIKSGCAAGTQDIECSKHYSGLYFDDTVMIDGKGCKWNSTQATTQCDGMPSPTSKKTITGNIGNGHAKITLISLD